MVVSHVSKIALRVLVPLLVAAVVVQVARASFLPAHSAPDISRQVAISAPGFAALQVAGTPTQHGDDLAGGGQVTITLPNGQTFSGRCGFAPDPASKDGSFGTFSCDGSIDGHPVSVSFQATFKPVPGSPGRFTLDIGEIFAWDVPGVSRPEAPAGTTTAVTSADSALRTPTPVISIPLSLKGDVLQITVNGKIYEFTVGDGFRIPPAPGEGLSMSGGREVTPTPAA